MKLGLLGIILGIAIHMFYLDIILISEYRNLDNCLNSAEYDDFKINECYIDFDSLYKNHKIKYFGLYRLFKYKKLTVDDWSME